METHHFRDFDAFAASVNGVECTMMLQNPRRRLWSINDVALGAIRVQSGQVGSGNIVEGQSLADKYMLYMPLSDNCSYSANGVVIKKDEFGILEPGCEFCVSTKHEHDWCTAVVPAKLLAIGSNSNEPTVNSEKTTCRVTRANRQLANRFIDVIRQIHTTAAVCPNFESELAAKNANAVLTRLASAIVGLPPIDEPQARGRRRTRRQDIIPRAMDLLENSGEEPVFVSQMAIAAGVSERTLRRAFVEYFGVGPVRYLQLRQLHLVNRLLRSADPDVDSVTDIFIRAGEWELGRFSGRYRRLFGELPMETLRRK